MGFPGQAGELGRSGFSEKLLLSKQTKDWWRNITSVKFSPPQHGHWHMLTHGHIYVNTHTHTLTTISTCTKVCLHTCEHADTHTKHAPTVYILRLSIFKIWIITANLLNAKAQRTPQIMSHALSLRHRWEELGVTRHTFSGHANMGILTACAT